MSMTCEEARDLVHALVDGELDAGHAREVEAHAAVCPRCRARLQASRELHAVFRAAPVQYAAPAGLRERVEAIAPLHPRTTSRRSILRGFAAGVALSSAAAASVVAIVLRSDDTERVLGEAVSAHLRSLQPGHLTDVLSTDRHTVKPWFNGRLDLAPPVMDLTAQGFTLIGGRLDYIVGKPVAAIVYRRRTHVINLFVAQALDSPPVRQSNVVQGFNVRRWKEQGLDLIAVSDLAPDELDEFCNKFDAAVRAT